jgi:hypothetical protein
MTAAESKSAVSFGFLTVCEHEGQGLFGGYLLLNSAGRPLEFYCTAPVRPNRAQEILYGPTLGPYLYGEQIGQALLDKAKVKPLLVFTDVEPALDVREYVSHPVVLVLSVDPRSGAELGPGPNSPAAEGCEPPPARAGTARLHTFAVGDQLLAVLRAYQREAADVVRQWQPYAGDFDAREPFQRIREAIDEARRSAKQAA